MRQQLENLFAGGEIDPILREELMAELLAAQPGAGGRQLPGGFPGGDVEEEEEEEEDGDEDEHEAEADRAARNNGFLARLAGVFGVGAARPPPPQGGE